MIKEKKFDKDYWLPVILTFFLVGNVFMYFNIISNVIFGVFMIGIGVGIFLKEYELKRK